MRQCHLMSTADQGIAGLLVDEIELTGILRMTKGLVAQFRHSGKSYLLRDGDAIADADVISVRRNEVVFKATNPSGPKPYREVVKTLSPEA